MSITLCNAVKFWSVNEILKYKLYLLSPPIQYHEIYHLENELHPKQSHQHGKVHSQKKPSQCCMTSPTTIYILNSKDKLK